MRLDDPVRFRAAFYNAGQYVIHNSYVQCNMES